MFTGLIEEVGTVRRVAPTGAGAHLHIAASRVLDGTRVGDSIAVNGPCLTVVRLDQGSFVADCMPETLERSTLGSLRPGSRVNLERALSLGDRLGGHLVAGHVDAVAEVQAVNPRGIASELRLSLPDELRPYVAAQGSIAVDGISLTVITAGLDHFVVGIIPHTLEATTLGGVTAGTRVNLEADVLARYVRRALMTPDAAPGTGAGPAAPGGRRDQGSQEDALTQEFLRDHGFG